MKGLFYFCNMLLFIGGSELIFVILFVVMLFGADKIPEIAKVLGKMIREVILELSGTQSAASRTKLKKGTS